MIYAKIFDATKSTINVEDAHASTKLLAATTLRNVLGTKVLSKILSDRESIAHTMQVDRLTQRNGRLLISFIFLQSKYYRKNSALTITSG